MNEHQNTNAIAIIGLSGRFPGASDVHTFWDNLVQGRESISEFTEEEVVEAVLHYANPVMVPHLLEKISTKSIIKKNGVLDDLDMFDAGFFDYSPKEAELLDPQQRFFLECSSEALEMAGYNTDTYPGLIGVFGGLGASDYYTSLVQFNPDIIMNNSMVAGISNQTDYLATRVAYKLDLKGPAFTVQSACSTSMVAIHNACQALLAGECDMALGGGVTIQLPQKSFYPYEEGSVGSPDGRVRTFDAKAKGTLFTNACSVLLFKRLEDAVEDGDHIFAVVKATAINNDGRHKVGYTAPSVDGQERVVQEAVELADISPNTISYVESHGTGTSIGDPIEIAALERVYKQDDFEPGSCLIGSVKTNIGHTNRAAGATSLIKTALALKNELIPATLHFDEPNPKIDFDQSPFRVVTELTPWKRSEEPRRAAVSAFGMGGTNAHTIVEEAPEVEPSGPSRDLQMLVLSAKTSTALDNMSDNLADYLEKNPDIPLADVAYTLQVGRRRFNHYRVITCKSHEEACSLLRERPGKQVMTGFHKPQDRDVVFMFPGQGSQDVMMGHDLYQTEPVFREAVDACAELLKPHLGLDLRHLLYPEGDHDEARAKLKETRYTQPALFVIEYAMAKLWMSLGVKPAMMIGHSVGEYVAAHLAGVFSLEDGLKLIAARGSLMQEVEPGDMLSVPLSEQELEPFMGDALSLAAVNAPRLCVASGPSEAVAQLRDRLKESGVATTMLHTSHAFHSSMMNVILDRFTELVAGVSLNVPKLRYVSNLSGDWIRDDQACAPTYWADHLRGAVRFSEGVTTLIKEPNLILLETGPGSTLATLARKQLRGLSGDEAAVALTSMRRPKDERGDMDAFLRSLGQLSALHQPIDWSIFYRDERRLKTPLPTYPFDRQRYWVDKYVSEDADMQFGKKEDIADWFSIATWRRSALAKPLAEAPKATSEEGVETIQPLQVIFSDEFGVGDALAHQLIDSYLVRAGESYRQLDDRTFEMRIDEEEDYANLLAAITGGDDLPMRIIYCWSLKTGPTIMAEEDDTGVFKSHCFYGPLYLSKAIGRLGGKTRIDVALVTNNAHEVVGGDLLYPESAAVVGPARVASKEYTRAFFRNVDVDLEQAPKMPVEVIQDEVLDHNEDAVIAYRGGRRWVQDFEPMKVDAFDGKPHLLRHEGVYLITGGLGGIGLTLAHYLAEQVNARLVLTGRSAFPPRQEWDTWLQRRGDANRVSQRILKIREIEAAGSHVMAMQADVTDVQDLRRLLGEVEDVMGSVNGVIHAAGVAGAGIIQMKTAETAESVLAPKIDGARALYLALDHEPLDFFISASSITSVLGGVGQVDYTAANAVLDAFAHYLGERHGITALSIGWGAWRDVGMAVNTKDLRRGGPPANLTKELGHPFLFQRKLESDTKVTYLTQLKTDDQWVLSEHKLSGKPTFPGTAYLELVRAAMTDLLGHDAKVVLRDVFFMAPLMLEEDETRSVQVMLEAQGDHYNFRVRSLAPNAKGETAWQDHTVGSAAHKQVAQPERVDLDALMQIDASVQHLTAEEQVRSAEDFVYWGPRWYTLTEVRRNETQTLARLSLPAEIYAEDLSTYGLHPALLDVATSIGAGKIKEGNYLPMSYRNMVVHKSLPAVFYSHVVAGDTSDETANARITLIDEAGEVLVTIEEFTLKRVAENNSVRNREQAETKEEGGELYDAIAPLEGVEAFHRLLTHRTPAFVVVDTKDLATNIKRSKKLARVSDGAQGKTAKPKHERPELETVYAEPTTEVERMLARIWREQIGIEQIGVNDDYFELGGDSILGIQIIAALKDEGYEITPAQLFEHTTVADLAKFLDQSGSTDKDETPVTMLQQQLLEQGTGQFGLWLETDLDPTILPDAWLHLREHHPLLAARLDREAGLWRYQTPDKDAAYTSSAAADALDLVLERAADQAMASLDLETGMPAHLVAVSAAGRIHLGLFVHGMIADRATLMTLLRDLVITCRALQKGEQPELPRPASSSDQWAEQLARYTASESFETQRALWHEATAQTVQPIAYDTTGETSGSYHELRTSLSVEETTAVLGGLGEARADVSEGVLAAVAMALTAWRQNTRLSLALHQDARALFRDHDFSGLAGLYTTTAPMTFDFETQDSPASVLKTVKEQMRAQAGLGLAGLGGKASGQTAPMAFEYLGDLDLPTGQDWTALRLVEDEDQTQLVVRAMILSGQLHITWRYRTDQFFRKTVDTLGYHAVDMLKQLTKQQDDALSTMDFPEADLSANDLSSLLGALDR